MDLIDSLSNDVNISEVTVKTSKYLKKFQRSLMI